MPIIFYNKNEFNDILTKIVYHKYNIKQNIIIFEYITIDNIIKLDTKKTCIDINEKYIISDKKYVGETKEDILEYYKKNEYRKIYIEYESIKIDTIDYRDSRVLDNLYKLYNENYNIFYMMLNKVNIDIYNIFTKFVLEENPICIIYNIKDQNEYNIIKEFNNIYRYILFITNKDDLYNNIEKNIKARKLNNILCIGMKQYNTLVFKNIIKNLYYNEIIIKMNNVSLLDDLDIFNIKNYHKKYNLIVEKEYTSFIRKITDAIPNYVYYDNRNEIISNYNNNKLISYLLWKYKDHINNTTIKPTKYYFDKPYVFDKISIYIHEKRYDEGNKLIDEYFVNKYGQVQIKHIMTKISLSTITKDIKNLDLYINIIKDIIEKDSNKDVYKSFLNNILFIILNIESIDKNKLKNFYLLYLNHMSDITWLLKVYGLILGYSKEITKEETNKLLDIFEKHYKKYQSEILSSEMIKKGFSIFFRLLQKNNDNDNICKFISILNNKSNIVLSDEKNIDKFFIYFKDYCPELIYNVYTNIDPYFNEQKEILELRSKNLNKLKKIIKIYQDNNIILDSNIVLGFYINNFYFSYHGENSKEYFQNKCKFFRTICPDLNYKFEYKKNKNKKIKLAFASDFLVRHHSVFKDRHQIIKKFSEDNRFKVYIITVSDLHVDVEKIFQNIKHIKIPQNIKEAQKIIEAKNLDFLVYCEIGMNPIFYYLAFLKLARYQLNTWGHSDTSGIDTVDYFMSSKLYEIDSAQDHYSEKLIKLDSMCTMYINPNKYTNYKTRYEFGFSDNYHIYLCAQSLFKILPEFDMYLLSILDKDPNSILILQDSVTDSKNKIIKRFDKYNIDLTRIHFIGSISHQLYMNYINISDVVLDPYPFGGCNSSLEAFSLGIPVVTQPSKMINGRFTQGFYKRMDINDLVVNNKKEYINKALQICKDKEYRKNIVQKIKDNNHKLYNDENSFIEWRDFILDLN
jgi:predicted O-linked N-acetylglucosamine transferase (SPINDLY family)